MPMEMLDTARGRFGVVQRGAGPVLLLVHGFPLSHAMWTRQVDGLSDSFRVIAPDLRGFGRSRPADDVSTMADFADDLAALLDALSIEEPVVLCGLSMGGYIAFEFLRRHASRVRALVLADTRAAGDTPEAIQARLKLAADVLADGARIVADAMLPKLFDRSTNENQPLVVDEIRNVMLAASPRGIAAAQRGMAQRADSTALLSEIAVPTLVVVGENDVITTVEEMHGMAALIRGVRFVVLPNAGHLAPQEQPEAFNSVVRQFVAGLNAVG